MLVIDGSFRQEIKTRQGAQFTKSQTISCWKFFFDGTRAQQKDNHTKKQHTKHKKCFVWKNYVPWANNDEIVIIVVCAIHFLNFTFLQLPRLAHSLHRMPPYTEMFNSSFFPVLNERSALSTSIVRHFISARRSASHLMGSGLCRARFSSGKLRY